MKLHPQSVKITEQIIHKKWPVEEIDDEIINLPTFIHSRVGGGGGNNEKTVFCAKYLIHFVCFSQLD